MTLPESAQRPPWRCRWFGHWWQFCARADCTEVAHGVALSDG